jgi:hypothetical protein
LLGLAGTLRSCAPRPGARGYLAVPIADRAADRSLLGSRTTASLSQTTISSLRDRPSAAKHENKAETRLPTLHAPMRGAQAPRPLGCRSCSRQTNGDWIRRNARLAGVRPPVAIWGRATWSRQPRRRRSPR